MAAQQDVSKHSSAAAAQEKKQDYAAPAGARKNFTFTAGPSVGGTSFDYEAEADWIVLRKDDKPKAEMFFVRYFKKSSQNRPLTFVFNGGPGASSVYLHMGALGPSRVDFQERGAPLPPPHALVDNKESWLQFTDLVFLDPIGTGFSRMIDAADGGRDAGAKGEASKADGAKADAPKEVEYWQLKRDLESLCECIVKFLSRFGRWESPVYLAGESYGGFRVAKLAKLLQNGYGVALSAAIIISPALEFTLLDGSDYDDLMWIDSFPTMAAAAAYHGRAKKKRKDEDWRAYARRAADFALRELLPVLAGGDLVGADAARRTLAAAADWIGIPRAAMQAKNGRVSIDWFSKNLLRDKGLCVGLYDASATVQDPFPDRDQWVGPDPTLHVIERVFAAGVNSQLRARLGLETERDYALSSDEVNNAWKVDTKQHALDSQVGSVDDLRYGMSVNPDMKVFICHGFFDMVTPFFSTARISRLMKLDAARSRMLTLKNYNGGHMFYTWAESRRAFFEDMRALYLAQ